MSEFVETPLGILPRSWQIKPLGETTIKIQDGTHFSPQTDEGPCLYLTSKNIKFGKFDIKDCGWISQQEHESIYARCDVKFGDLLLTKDGANTGNACLNNLTVPFSLLSSVAFLRTDGVTYHSGFILQYLLSPIGQRRLKDLMSGNAIPRLTLQKIKAFKTPVPTADEQRRIATILTTLDEVIEATEKLVEKHQQIKAGLMHDLFTRGLWTRPELARGDHQGTPAEATAQEGQLRPTPEEAPELYQDSPLGLVPKEWKVTSIERLLDRIIDYRGKTPVKTESGLPLITAKNVRMGFIDPEPREFIAEAAYETWMTRGIPKYSDILFTTEAPLGNVAQIGTTEKVAFAQRVIILQPASWVNPAFLKHLLISAKFQRSVFNLSSGTTALGVKQSEFRKVLVSHPSQTEEQESIANQINSMEYQEATQKLHLAKLRQQKQGLMHDLLTGRVRVDLSYK